MLKMAGKSPGRSSEGKLKKMSEAPTATMVAAAAGATTIPDEEATDEDEDAAKDIIMIRIII
jgi:hypothetical protein